MPRIDIQASNQAWVVNITDDIVGFYNAQRIHSTLGCLPPNTFEKLSADNNLEHSNKVSEKT
ncbi:MAG TPA: hypothetical protein PLD79_03775 [Halothiobacillus sp.]|nr:hypothetical protein [Halothiobacillus sp.]